MRKEVLAIAVAIYFLACNVEGKKCPPSSCGVVTNITYPFHLETEPADCKEDNHIPLSCEGNHTVIYANQIKYYVEEISYVDQQILLTDLTLQRNDFSSLPQNYYTPLDYHTVSYKEGNRLPYLKYSAPEEYVTYVKCSRPVDSPDYIPAFPCVSNSTGSFIYVLLGPRTLSVLDISCEVLGSVLLQSERLGNATYTEIHRVLLMGFRLQWGFDDAYEELCPTIFKRPSCFFKSSFVVIHDLFLKAIPIVEHVMIIRTSVGVFCLAVYLLYNWRKRHLSMDESIEAFLSDYKSHIPKRYSYWSIRLMTNWFKEKLGQGGFGSVYKGKLPNGHLVAVKMLGKAKGNVQDFINEVATIGRIHHVNIVQLIGFCSEGSKRALIYDFMPNGSLDKHLFSQEGTASSLSWEKLHQIALGVARGIEYLHRGCDMQILHFDIKPHNILLDEDFTPKVSDFGLAKFYSRDNSIASMKDARGTFGYMAPELFYHNVGRVTYKSDVYSYGMLLLEIAGRRKNLNAHAEKTSQIYFPSWIYDRLEQGGNVEFEDATEEEKAMAKKLIVIALWCIQMRPSDRPSMSKVVEMMEGSGDDLEMPPKPFLSSPERVLGEEYQFYASTSSTKTNKQPAQTFGSLSQ